MLRRTPSNPNYTLQRELSRTRADGKTSARGHFYFIQFPAHQPYAIQLRMTKDLCVPGCRRHLILKKQTA